jgi:hypothetical protein
MKIKPQIVCLRYGTILTGSYINRMMPGMTLVCQEPTQSLQKNTFVLSDALIAKENSSVCYSVITSHC